MLPQPVEINQEGNLHQRNPSVYFTLRPDVARRSEDAWEGGMFNTGDVVECVDAGPLTIPAPYFGRPSGLSLGAVYVIAAYHPAGSPVRRPGSNWREPCVDLREAPHPHPHGAFLARRFRLLKRRDPGLINRLLYDPVPALPPF
jgi:hypothetical protein